MGRSSEIAAWLALLCAGCALDSEGGVKPVVDAGFDAAALPDVSQPRVDAAADSAPEAATPDVADVAAEPSGPCSTAPGACMQSVAGWEVVAFEIAATADCPAGYAQTDGQADPTLALGACDCSCTITAEPCLSGTIPTYYSNASGCGSSGQSLNIPGTGCVDFPGGNLGNYYRSPPLPVGGACVGAPLVDASKLATASARVCAPPQACLEEICAGQAPAGFRSCIRAPGDQPCPPGPFAEKHLLVDGASVACSDCPSCTVSAQCDNPRIAFHSNNSCTNHVVTLASDNSCVPTGGQSFVSSLQYLVDVVAKSCAADGPKQANVSTTNPVTICCR